MFPLFFLPLLPLRRNGFQSSTGYFLFLCLCMKVFRVPPLFVFLYGNRFDFFFMPFLSYVRRRAEMFFLKLFQGCTLFQQCPWRISFFRQRVAFLLTFPLPLQTLILAFSFPFFLLPSASFLRRRSRSSWSLII